VRRVLPGRLVPRGLLIAFLAAAVVAGVLAGLSEAASSPVARAADGAGSPVPYSDLQLASTSATRSYGDPTSTIGDCTGLAQTFQTPVSLSADGNGNGVLNVGTENLGSQAHSITELSDSELELSYSATVSSGDETSPATSTFEGYGASFSGTYTLTVSGPTGPCTTTRPQTLTLQGSGLTLVSPVSTTTTTSSTTSSTASTSTTSSSTTTTTTTTSTTTTSSSTTGGSVNSPPPTLTYPCSTAVVSPCNAAAITLSGAPLNPVDGYVPEGTAEYKQLLALGYIPVSGDCDESCVIEVQALLSSGQLKLAARAHLTAVQLESLGEVRLRIHHGAASARLGFTRTGKRVLREVTAKHFVIEIELWASSPSGKRLGKTKVAYLHVVRK
jgi:hypothetical protein